jgi:hypothetical protein
MKNLGPGDNPWDDDRRRKFLEFGARKGEGLILDGQRVVLVDVHDFEFTLTVRIESSGALVTLPFERLTRSTG